MATTKAPHGRKRITCTESRPYTEEEIREKLQKAKEEGASYARVHTVAKRSIQLYKRDNTSPSGSMRVDGVPKTKANWKLVREIIGSTRSPGSLRRGTDY